jgi:hypothetical protein
MLRKTPIFLALAILLTGFTSFALEREMESRKMATEAAAAEMAAAANAFLASLSDDQRAGAAFEFEEAERTRWHFIPGEMHARQGVMIREMNEAQRGAAHDLLRSGLSDGGYATANAVMQLEDILNVIEGADGRFERDSELYFLSVFGTPGPEGAWGWRFEGHHMSLHFTVVEGTWVATAPAFLGSNPAEVREGPSTGLRILAEREDVARQLFASLDDAQRSVALVSEDAPNDILTGADMNIDPLMPTGISAAELRSDQRDLLMSLVEVYAGFWRDDLSAARMEALGRIDVDDLTFAWAGSGEVGARHYYRVQSPSFLIEYDNTQNDANHVHSVWRDFDGDFGEDLLREHLAAVPH